MGLLDWCRRRQAAKARKALARYSGYAGAEPSRLDRWEYACELSRKLRISVTQLENGARPFS